MGKMSELDYEMKENAQKQEAGWSGRYKEPNYGYNDAGEQINSDEYSSDDLYELWKQKQGYEDEELEKEEPTQEEPTDGDDGDEAEAENEI